MKLMCLMIFALLAGAARADTFDYSCKVGSQTLPLKVDDGAHELTWRGHTYAIKEQESCAKFGWHAERPGDAFDFCTATQGYADIQRDGAQVECRQD